LFEEDTVYLFGIIMGINLVLAAVLAWMVFSGWSTDDQRCYREEKR